MLEVLDTSDVDKFKAAVDTMAEKFPGVVRDQTPPPPPYAAYTGTFRGTGCGMLYGDPIAKAFKPDKPEQ